MKILNLTSMAIFELAEAATRAMADGREFRLAVDGDTFKYKTGGDMWSAPLYGTKE